MYKSNWIYVGHEIMFPDHTDEAIIRLIDWRIKWVWSRAICGVEIWYGQENKWYDYHGNPATKYKTKKLNAIWIQAKRKRAQIE